MARQKSSKFRPRKRKRICAAAAKRAVPNQETKNLIFDDTSSSQSDQSSSDDALTEDPLEREDGAQKMESTSNFHDSQGENDSNIDKDMEVNQTSEEKGLFWDSATDDSSNSASNATMNLKSTESQAQIEARSSSLCRDINNMDLVHGNIMTPEIGSLYKKRDGTVFSIRSVDEKNRLAKCQELLPSRFVDWKTIEGESKKGREYDDEGFVEVPFNELPSSCLIKDWVYDFDPEIKHEFTIKKRGKKKKTKNRRRKLRTLELFAGAGGMSLGLLRAKCDVRWAVENNQNAACTLRTNLSKDKVYEEDVRNFLKRSKEGNATYPRQDEVDYIHASPPCQGFCGANTSGGPNDESNNELSLVSIDVVHHFRPKTVTYENVMGLIDKNNRKNQFQIIADLLFLGYQIRFCVLDANDYGDAQNRKRVIIFAAEEDMRLPSKPEPTYGRPPLMAPRTVGDAIRFLEDYEPYTRSTKDSSIREIRDDGMLIRDHCAPESKDEEGPNKEKNGNQKLSWDMPAGTAMCTNKFIHPDKKRFLSVREYACLQSFPVDWNFYGGEGEKFKQIGNAVPVCMATHIARSVAQAHGMP